MKCLLKMPFQMMNLKFKKNLRRKIKKRLRKLSKMVRRKLRGKRGH